MDGIIFDCDGTLVNSLNQALESFNYALHKIGETSYGLADIKRHFGAAADRIFLNLLGDRTRALQAFEHYLEHQTELAKTTRLHDGIEELLDTLKKERIPMAIVTGRHTRDLEIVLRPHGLSSAFLALVTDNRVPKSKPAPDGILMAAELMKIPPARTLYVGDSVVDMQAAHAAGSTPVAALWDGLTKPGEMAKEKPAFMAKRPDEVWTFFKKFRARGGQG